MPSISSQATAEKAVYFQVLCEGVPRRLDLQEKVRIAANGITPMSPFGKQLPAEYLKQGQILSGLPLTNVHIHHHPLGMLEDSNTIDLHSQKRTVSLERGSK